MKAYLTAMVMILGVSGPGAWAAMDESSPCGMMQQQFEQMQGTMGKARQAKNARTHQQLMAEHMRQMQKGMGMMGGMMHDMMHGGKGGMMQGGKGGMMQGGKGGMMQGDKGGMMQGQSSGMMSNEMMAQRMEHLQKRMDMMQQMMQQLMDHMAEQERMHGK